MLPVVGRRTGCQFEARGAVEDPDHEQMREALDIGESGLEFRQNIENALGIMLHAESLGNFGRLLVRTFDGSDGPERKHGWNLSIWIIVDLRRRRHRSGK